MELLEFSILGGSKIAINPKYIVDIYPSVYCNRSQTCIRVLGKEEPISIDCDYNIVIKEFQRVLEILNKIN